MNTKQNTQTKTTEAIQATFLPAGKEKEAPIGAADKPADTIMMHDAKIITPQPYGVFALCKIIEHLQNN